MTVLKMSAAASRAESLVGGPTPNGEANWCLQWTVQNVYGHYGPYRWGGNGAAWAINYWYAAVGFGRVVKTSDVSRIPRGALTFSKGASKYGHVFIGLGDGMCATTDYPRARKIGEVRITDLLRGWNHKLLGYVEVTGDGVDLRDSQTVEQRRMDPDNYYMGAQGEHVLWLGKRLLAHGYKRTPPYRPTTKFTTADRIAVAWFQRQQGWVGGGADGFPGEQTLERLAE